MLIPSSYKFQKWVSVPVALDTGNDVKYAEILHSSLLLHEEVRKL
jgi:hypothetical protein